MGNEVVDNVWSCTFEAADQSGSDSGSVWSAANDMMNSYSGDQKGWQEWGRTKQQGCGKGGPLKASKSEGLHADFGGAMLNDTTSWKGNPSTFMGTCKGKDKGKAGTWDSNA